LKRSGRGFRFGPLPFSAGRRSLRGPAGLPVRETGSMEKGDAGRIGGVAVIVAAGGSGTRMGGSRAKQYLPLGGIPLIVHVLRRFQECPLVGKILLVVPGGDIPFVREEILDKYEVAAIASVTAGGRERQDSVRNGLSLTGEGDGIVLVHDGARPFVTPALIEAVIRAAGETGAVCPGIPLRDTVKSAGDDGLVSKTLDRNRLWAVQTPQGFRREVLLEAFRRAGEDGFYGTDEASLVERTGRPVRIIRGAEENIKITTPEDLLLGEYLLNRRGRVS